MTEDLSIMLNLAMVAAGAVAAWLVRGAAWKGAIAVLVGLVGSTVLGRYAPGASLTVLNVVAVAIMAVAGAAMRMRPVAIIAAIVAAYVMAVLFGLAFVVDWNNLPAS